LFLHTFSCIEGPSFQNQYHLRSKKYWMWWSKQLTTKRVGH
jgi:hypothetical protein